MRGAAKADERAIAAPYKPLKPDALYLTEAEWEQRAGRAARCALLSPFTGARHA